MKAEPEEGRSKRFRRKVGQVLTSVFLMVNRRRWEDEDGRRKSEGGRVESDAGAFGWGRSGARR